MLFARNPISIVGLLTALVLAGSAAEAECSVNVAVTGPANTMTVELAGPASSSGDCASAWSSCLAEAKAEQSSQGPCSFDAGGADRSARPLERCLQSKGLYSTAGVYPLATAVCNGR